MGIFVPFSTHPAQWQEVERLRASGERVVSGAKNQSQPHDYQACDRLLAEVDGQFEIQSLA